MGYPQHCWVSHIDWVVLFIRHAPSLVLPLGHGSPGCEGTQCRGGS